MQTTLRCELCDTQYAAVVVDTQDLSGTEMRIACENGHVLDMPIQSSTLWDKIQGDWSKSPAVVSRGHGYFLVRGDDFLDRQATTLTPDFVCDLTYEQWSYRPRHMPEDKTIQVSPGADGISVQSVYSDPVYVRDVARHVAATLPRFNADMGIVVAPDFLTSMGRSSDVYFTIISAQLVTNGVFQIEMSHSVQIRHAPVASSLDVNSVIVVTLSPRTIMSSVPYWSAKRGHWEIHFGKGDQHD